MRNIFKISWLLLIECYLISWVKATDPKTLNSCTGNKTSGATDCDDASYYCTQTDGSNTTILKLKTSADENYCVEIKDEGYYIFEISDADSSLKLLASSDSITTAGDLAIYKCDGSTCTPQYGHFKHNDKYYTISASEAATEIVGSGYYSIINDSTNFIKCTPSATQGQPSTCQSFTKTNGYFMNSDKEVYACDESSCTLKTIATVTTCSGHSNDIIKDNNILKFCNTESSTALAFSSTTQYNLFSGFESEHDKYPTSITNDSTDIILLKIEQYSITMDTGESDGFFIADNDKNLLSAAGDGTLYNCSSGVCTSTTAADIGYYINGDTFKSDTIPYIECPDTTGCKAILESEIEECSSSTIGQLIQGGKFCINESLGYTFLDTAKNYRINYSENSIFIDTVTQEGLYGIIKIGTNSIKILNTFTDKVCVAEETLEITSSSSSCGEGKEECKYQTTFSGTCYYDCVKSTGANCIAGKYYLFNEDNLSDGTSAGTLINCETVNEACEEVTNVVGYFKNSDFNTVSSKPYIKCAEDAATSGTIKCELMAAPSDACSSSTIGQLTNDSSVINLCLDGTKKQPFASTNEYEYLLTYHASSIYKMIIPENKFGIIKISQDAMIIDTNFQSDYGVCADADSKVTTLTQSSTTCTGTRKGFCNGGICYDPCQVSSTNRVNCNADTYYLVKDASSSIPVVDHTQSGKLYFCESGGTGGCTEITDAGYYINEQTDAFICEKGDSFTCKIYSITGTCTSDNIGKPIIDTSVLYFCLNYDNTKETNKDIKTDEMTGTLDKNYLLTYKSGNIFGITSGKSGLVSVKAKSVTLVDKTGYCLESKSNSNNLSVAASTEGNPYQCTDGICEAISNDDNSLKEGYYKNIGAISSDPEYIAYTTVSTTVDGVTTTTKKYTAKAATSGTTCSAIGDILVDNNVFSLCLTTSIKIELDPEGSKNGKYFIKVTDNGIVFKQKSDENSHAIIVVENENVYLSEKEENVEIYRYGKSTTQKLLNFNNANEKTDQCNADKTLKNALLEFSLIDEVTGDTTNYYKLETTTP